MEKFETRKPDDSLIAEFGTQMITHAPPLVTVRMDQSIDERAFLETANFDPT